MRIKTFIFLLSIVAMVVGAGVSAQDLPETFPNGIAAGDATQTSVVLWARSTTPGTVNFEVATDEGFSDVIATLSANVEDPLQPVKVIVEDLAPGQAYFYRVTDAAASTLTGQFEMPHAVGTNSGVRFGVTGDWRGELSPYPAITNAVERDLDFFVLHGDTIYSDYPSLDVPKPQAETLEDYRMKHAEVYGTRYDLNGFAPLRSSMLIYAMIDDHEVTNDFAGGAAPSYDPRFADYEGEFVNETALYQNGLQAFQEYNPVQALTYTDTGDPLVDGKPNLYRYRTFGSDAAIFLLDARSFRSEPLAPVVDITDQSEVISFLNAALDDTRTMLGAPQFAQLQLDLLDAQANGITWKFVMVPEPIQNFGSLAAEDRYEGYAAERAALLRFIEENALTNVVFVSADFHGTVVNNLTYQAGLRDLFTSTHNPTRTFEIVTGSVAFDEPFGPTVVRLAHDAELITDEQFNTYFELPRDEQDDFMEALINGQIEPLGYTLVGLDDAEGVSAELIEGKYLATNFFGWTEFDIAADTQVLTVTTYGIDPYDVDELNADPASITARTPEIVSQFVVQPQ